MKETEDEADFFLDKDEGRFSVLLNGIKDYAIFLLDPEGRVRSWNAGAEAIKGYREEEILGQSFTRFYPPEAIDQNWPKRELEAAALSGRFEDEGWRVRKDGSRFWANVVITALRDQKGKLRGYTKVTRDMTERKRIKELEEAGYRMNEFLSALAHELRNPLAPIRNAANVMLEKSSEHPALSWAGHLIDRQVSHLSRLVDDLLEVNRVINGSIQLKKEPVEMTMVINLALESIRTQIDVKKIQVAVNFQGESMRILGDPVRLSQILSNLLENAARHTEEGGKININIDKEGAEVVLRVKDSGVGLQKGTLPDPSIGLSPNKLENRTEKPHGETGLGIGLVLVRRLVEMHGGTIETQGPGQGQGSEFIARFPIILSPTELTSSNVSAPKERLVVGSTRRVLVVDDNLDSAESLLIFLELRGHKVESANDGQTAIEIAEKMKPHIVFLDIDLPGMDGYEVARKIRDLPGMKFVSLVALTGYGLEEYRHRSVKAGIDLHLVKPVESHRIESVIHQLTSSAFPEAQHN